MKDDIQKLIDDLTYEIGSLELNVSNTDIEYNNIQILVGEKKRILIKLKKILAK